MSLVQSLSLSLSRSLTHPHPCRRHEHHATRLASVSMESSRAHDTHPPSVADTTAVLATPHVAWCRPRLIVFLPVHHHHTLSLSLSPHPASSPLLLASSSLPSPRSPRFLADPLSLAPLPSLPCSLNQRHSIFTHLSTPTTFRTREPGTRSDTQHDQGGHCDNRDNVGRRFIRRTLGLRLGHQV